MLSEKQKELCSGSTVRTNLLTQPGYTPYCGSDKCNWHWPRVKWSGITEKFYCECGWVSGFQEEFIQEYLKVRNNVCS